jgi:hypothetical protein
MLRSTINRQLAIELAEKTMESFSYDRYADWTDCAHAILDLGHTELECEAILRSKWMRWAADYSNQEHGKVEAQAIVNAIQDSKHVLHGSRQTLSQALADLVQCTFGD